MDQLPRLGKRELICLLLFTSTCNYVVSARRGFLFLWVLGMGYVILLWHALSLPYNYFKMYLLRGVRSYFLGKKRRNSFNRLISIEVITKPANATIPLTGIVRSY